MYIIVSKDMAKYEVELIIYIMVKLRFLGATECVTGSCHLLTVDDKNILLDCGLFQSHDTNKYDNEVFDFNPEEIDYVVLSHSHVDHSGRIPLLFKRGFKGKVICTSPTKDLCEYLLKDTAKIQGEETYFNNLSRQKENLEPLIPLYEEKDVNAALDKFIVYNYGEEIILEDNIKIILKDAGHILGSAICEILIKVNASKWNKLIYSGDLGNINKDILNDPQNHIKGDFLIIESTYGNKIHEVEDNYPKFLEIVRETMNREGNLIIPCFSLGRTQEIIYMLNSAIESGEIKGCNVYVDSPLASNITKIFRKYEDYFDRDAKLLIKRGDDPMEFKGLHFTESTEESQKLDSVKSRAVIIVAGGMYDGGRVSKHLRNSLARSECGIIITSYQGNKSIGSNLLKGDKEVSIGGENIEVKAKIHYIGGLSGHADKKGLINWVESMNSVPKKIFIVHGEGENIESLAKELKFKNYNIYVPKYSEESELMDNF
ncbi:MBL fold metallo-hydrolase [Clostridium sp.]|uniref:MBL fold metallo-hydrolase n=1 Tax=Clostridium sp. TaxID=1506 RepID=UPI003022D42A